MQGKGGIEGRGVANLPQPPKRNYTSGPPFPQIKSGYGICATIASMYKSFMLNLRTRRAADNFRKLKYSVLLKEKPE
jgi:hypothetical protein